MKNSVVVCAHNEENYIGPCLESIFKQTLKPHQVIVVSDKCTDDTTSIVASYPSISIIKKERDGWENSIAENLESARKYVDGDVFSKVDADVVLDPNYFEVLMPLLNDEVVGVSGWVITKSPNVLGKLMRLWEKTYHLSPLKTYLPAGCALMVKKKFLDEIGGFRDLPASDTYLHQKALERGLRFRFIKDTTAHHCRKLTLRRIIHTQIEYGKRRKTHCIPLWKTILHAFIRLRPFVLYGWFKARFK